MLPEHWRTLPIKIMPDVHIVVITGSIVVLTLAVLTLRVGESRFPTRESRDIA